MAKRAKREPEVFEIKQAVRHKTPQILCIYGVQFSGKTMGALLVGSGLVKPGGRIGFIDTENGRGSSFADDPDIIKAIPQGYSVIEIHPPFHPCRYIDAINQFEREGFDLIIGDSFSHAWEGEGGGLDMKEEDGSWKDAKLWSKRLKFAIVYSSIDMIVCLRAQEKTKVEGTGRDQKYSSMGILPICEKSLPFDIGTAIRCEGEVDGKPATHLATPVKWPKHLNWLFDKWTPQLLTADIGRRIREWNDSGQALAPGATIQKQARHAAELGMEEYAAFFKALPKAQKELLANTTHAENKQIAAMATAGVIGARLAELESREGFYRVLGAMGYESLSDVKPQDQLTVLAELEAALGDAVGVGV
jgi:hypothetical protein